MMSLQPISATSAYPLLPSQAVSICNLQRQALCWFHVPGLQLDNEVSHGTVCHQHYSHQTCQRAPSSGPRRRTCSRPQVLITPNHARIARLSRPRAKTSPVTTISAYHASHEALHTVIQRVVYHRLI